jgi:hypothetical protein
MSPAMASDANYGAGKGLPEPFCLRLKEMAQPVMCDQAGDTLEALVVELRALRNWAGDEDPDSAFVFEDGLEVLEVIAAVQAGTPKHAPSLH